MAVHACRCCARSLQAVCLATSLPAHSLATPSAIRLAPLAAVATFVSPMAGHSRQYFIFVLQNSKISGSRSCGPPLKANGAMCGVGTECSSGICSTSGHCCATACPLCGTCASGSCVATCMTAGGCTNPMCPVITCTGILKGFNAAVCEKYTGSTTTGVCQNVKIISIMSYFEC